MSITIQLSQLNNNSNFMSSNMLNLPRWLKRLVCRFVGYYNGEDYNFELNENEELLLSKRKNNKQTPLIYIISKEFYKELSKTYPIENKNELRKILSLENSNSTICHIFGENEGVSSVNKWEINESVPKSLICLPESLLIGYAKSSKILSVKRLPNTQPIYVARSDKALNSATKSNLIKSEEMFKTSIGVDLNHHVSFVTESDFPKVLVSGLRKIPLNIVFRFGKIPQIKNKITLLKEIFIPFSMVYFAYLIISSLFILIQQNSLEEMLKEQSNDVTIALKQQSNLEELKVKYNQLHKVSSEQKNVSIIWTFLAEHFLTTQFSNIRMVGNRFVLRGITVSATSLLEKLNDVPEIQNAKFDFPTRKSKSKDVFVISFLLNEQSLSSVQDLNEQGKN